jgi:hypothetical protein
LIWQDIVLLRQEFCVLAWIVDLILDFVAADRAFGVIANPDHYLAGRLPWFGYRLGNWRFLPNLNHDLAPFALDLWHVIAPIVHGNVTTASSNSISQRSSLKAVWSPNLSLLRYPHPASCLAPEPWGDFPCSDACESPHLSASPSWRYRSAYCGHGAIGGGTYF